MAGYSVVTAGQPLAVVVGALDVRFTGVTVYNNSTNAPFLAVLRYNGTPATVSGGTAITPSPLRGGSPPCFATARYGDSLTYGGTRQVVYEYGIGTGTASSSGPGDLQSAPSTASQGSLLPIIATSGSILAFYVSDNKPIDPYAVITFYFEELRLQGSY